LQIRSIRFCARSTKSNCRSGFFGKKYSISKKKNQLNRSPDEGDIADLKSALFVEILVTAEELQRRSGILVPRSGFLTHGKMQNDCSISENRS